MQVFLANSFFGQRYWQLSCSKNAGGIDTWCQYHHQHGAVF